MSEYYSYWWTEPGASGVKKISAYSPAPMGQGFLVVSAVINYDDIYIPIAEGFLKLVMAPSGIMGTVLLMVAYISRLVLQWEENMEQTAYLTELNRLLEEMHQSEEVITHQQRLQTMGTVTGGITHEFNNLLTSIVEYAELLTVDLDEECEGYDSVSKIYEASVETKEVIQQIFSLSRKDMKTAYENMGVEWMVKRALEMVRPVCLSNVHLETNLDFRGKRIPGSETQLNQVILNICVNSTHVMGREDGRILVRGRVAKRGELERGYPVPVSGVQDEYVRVDTEGNSCGMSQDVLKQMLDSFFVTKKDGKGTGLGLAPVEQIVTSHGRYIYVQSQPENGNISHLYLSVSKQTEPDGEEMGTETREPGLQPLIADDNPKVLRLLEKNFHCFKIPVATAMGFEEIEKLLKPCIFDVVVADQYMEGGNAVDFCMSIRGQYPGLIEIVMADKVDKELTEARQRRVVDEYIDKPVSGTLIPKALRSCGWEVEA